MNKEELRLKREKKERELIFRFDAHVLLYEGINKGKELYCDDYVCLLAQRERENTRDKSPNYN